MAVYSSARSNLLIFDHFVGEQLDVAVRVGIVRRHRRAGRDILISRKEFGKGLHRPRRTVRMHDVLALGVFRPHHSVHGQRSAAVDAVAVLKGMISDKQLVAALNEAVVSRADDMVPVACIRGNDLAAVVGRYFRELSQGGCPRWPA